MKELQQRIKRVTDIWGPNGSRPSKTIYEDEVGKIRKDIVDFHGEMVLLVNYSNINYTGSNPWPWLIRLNSSLQLFYYKCSRSYLLAISQLFHSLTFKFQATFDFPNKLIKNINLTRNIKRQSSTNS